MKHLHNAMEHRSKHVQLCTHLSLLQQRHKGRDQVLPGSFLQRSIECSPVTPVQHAMESAAAAVRQTTQAHHSALRLSRVLNHLVHANVLRPRLQASRQREHWAALHQARTEAKWRSSAATHRAHDSILAGRNDMEQVHRVTLLVPAGKRCTDPRAGVKAHCSARSGERLNSQIVQRPLQSLQRRLCGVRKQRRY